MDLGSGSDQIGAVAQRKRMMETLEELREAVAQADRDAIDAALAVAGSAGDDPVAAINARTNLGLAQNRHAALVGSLAIAEAMAYCGELLADTFAWRRTMVLKAEAELRRAREARTASETRTATEIVTQGTQSLL